VPESKHGSLQQALAKNDAGRAANFKMRHDALEEAKVQVASDERAGNDQRPEKWGVNHTDGIEAVQAPSNTIRVFLVRSAAAEASMA
jgi:hypothetical protein